MKSIAAQNGSPTATADEVAPIASESVTPQPAIEDRKLKETSGPRDSRRPADRFPVVALCGSAGALDAFEKFFAHLPAQTGIAFVVVLHRLPDPEQGEALTQVLQRFTPLPVAEAHDGLRVRPNHVYVIPPAYDLSLLHGSLFLLKPTQPAGRRQPIDFFLQTLAKDVGDRAVCIICSGLGTDGTIGLKLVMENFGMVMAQAPETAAFDVMPRAALATEFVDFVLPPSSCPPSCSTTSSSRWKCAACATPTPTRPPSRPTRSKKSSCSFALRQATTLAFISATPCFGALSGA